jgi:hypothetical protein
MISNAACSSSTASAMAQPILTQLRSFGGKIDDHIKLLSNTEEPDEEELMTLSSLSSLCEDIINIVGCFFIFGSFYNDEKGTFDPIYSIILISFAFAGGRATDHPAPSFEAR